MREVQSPLASFCRHWSYLISKGKCKTWEAKRICEEAYCEQGTLWSWPLCYEEVRCDTSIEKQVLPADFTPSEHIVPSPQVIGYEHVTLNNVLSY